jgi:hypothetical protein
MSRFLSRFIFALLLFPACLVAQVAADTLPKADTAALSNPDDLLALLETKNEKPRKDYVQNAFKGIKVINAQSLERLAPGSLNFMIQHRFGTFKNGAYNLFGLDNATMRIGLDLGITPWLQIGIGRATYGKVLDGYFKAAIVRQQKGRYKIPVTILFYGDVAYRTSKWTAVGVDYKWYHRFTYTAQLIIGSKIHERFSIQIMPTMIHRNMVPLEASKNTVFSMGIGSRVKITKRVAAIFETFIPITKSEYPSFRQFPAMSFGVDIETGGHVFQLHFTNAVAMTDNGYIHETSYKWRNAEILFGFNMSREFAIWKNKKTHW